MKLIKNKFFWIAGIILIISVYFIFDSSDISDKSKGPDLLFYNGNIITVDETMTGAEAVAVSGDRIIYVGSCKTALTKVSKNHKKIDLKGRTLIPGFNDNHTHTFGAGVFYESPMLWGKSCEEIVEIVKAEAAKKEPGELIQGSSWDYTTCPNPHKSMLDRAAPENPVFLTQYSGHAAWVNSQKLKEMDIDKDTPDPKGGQIVRDKSNDATGILRDTAMGSSNSQYASTLLFDKNHRRVMDIMLKRYREAGITSVQDNTWEPLTARLLNKYKKEGKLTCRFTCWPYGASYGIRHIMKLASYDKIWVRKGLTKYFADGAFSTRTAWLLDKAYADEPGNFGKPRYTDQEMEEVIMDAARDRRQITMHAIGDAAVKQILDAVEKAQKKYPWTDKLRLRIEHAQIVSPEDITRMKKLGVLACVQPFSLCTPAKDITLLGPDRAKKAYPFYAMYKAGVNISFGSDVPAEVDYKPLLAIYYAVTRMNKAGTEGPLNKAERFTPYEALYCYTMGSAYAEFMEDEKGSITKGKLADLVVLSEDLTSVKKSRIRDIDVLMTVVGGRIVYGSSDKL